MEIKKLNYVGFKMGDYLTDLIRGSGLSQRDICNITYISESMLSKYCNDVKFPSKRTFKSILDVVVKELPFENRNDLIAEKMAVYESIKQSYLKVR